MKTVILCGGKGTRMKEETEFKPKPLVTIGEKPIVWHIMKTYAHYGFNDFVLALGYKGNMFKDYFLHEQTYAHDFVLDTQKKEIGFHGKTHDDFKITFADTGLESLTGERLLKIQKYIEDDEFMVTYGDGVGDIDINALIAFHHSQETLATLTAVHPYSKFGLINIDPASKRATSFVQKPLMKEYVSSGFMIFNKKVFDYLDNGPVENAFPKLIERRQLSVYRHEGFWKCMDTYAEMEEMNALWETKRPWAVWEQKNDTCALS